MNRAIAPRQSIKQASVVHFENEGSGVYEMAQGIRVLAIKPDVLSSIPETHPTEDGSVSTPVL